MRFGWDRFLICLPLRHSLIGFCLFDILIMIILMGFHVKSIIMAIEDGDAPCKYFFLR